MPASVRGDYIHIEFAFNPTLVSLVKQLPQRQWKPAEPGKPWVVPATPFHAKELIRLMGPHIQINPDVQVLAQKDGRFDRLHANREIVVGQNKAYPFQVAGVNFLNMVRGRGLICDEVGTGKTVQAILWAKENRCKGIVVVAPASVTYKWLNEFKRWWPGQVSQVIATGKDEIGEKTTVVILSYAMLNRYVQRVKLFKRNLVIFDEFHHLKNHKTQQFKAGKSLADGVPHVIGLSGTPLLNRPIEMYNMLHMIDPITWDFWGYMRRYCYDEETGVYSGAFRLNELEDRLKMVMIRRYKREVNDQIQPMTRTTVPVEIDMTDYRQVFAGNPKAISRIFPEQDLTTIDLPLVWLNLMRRLLEREKTKLAVEWIEDFLAETDNRKLLIYCPHIASIMYLTDNLRTYGTVAITGDLVQKKRQDIIDRWQNTLTERIMFITSAGAEGIDLFGKGGIDSSTILFVGREWGPAPEEQAEGRVDRAGQQFPVEAIYLVAKGTIDEDIDRLIQAKRAVIKSAVGAYEHVTVVGDLIGILRKKGITFRKPGDKNA